MIICKTHNHNYPEQTKNYDCPDCVVVVEEVQENEQPKIEKKQKKYKMLNTGENAEN